MSDSFNTVKDGFEQGLEQVTQENSNENFPLVSLEEVVPESKEVDFNDTSDSNETNEENSFSDTAEKPKKKKGKQARIDQLVSTMNMYKNNWLQEQQEKSMLAEYAQTLEAQVAERNQILEASQRNELVADLDNLERLYEEAYQKGDTAILAKASRAIARLEAKLERIDSEPKTETNYNNTQYTNTNNYQQPQNYNNQETHNYNVEHAYEWQARNNWYGNDPRLTQIADKISDDIAANYYANNMGNQIYSQRYFDDLDRAINIKVSKTNNYSPTRNTGSSNRVKLNASEMQMAAMLPDEIAGQKLSLEDKYKMYAKNKILLEGAK